MLTKLVKTGLVLALSVGLGQIVISDAFAAPKKSYNNISDLPRGIQNQIARGKTFNENSKWGKVIDGFEGGSNNSGGTAVASSGADVSGQIQAICPSTLDDEAMRLCLGLPAPKKAVRVKKLNVQLGEAQ